MFAAVESQRRVPRRTLVHVFVRSLFLQAGFNPRVMQGLGVAFAMLPALKSLYAPGPGRSDAVRRHLVLFNTHPTFAAGIVGALVRMEERAHAGEVSTNDVVALRSAFASPLAAIGDSFFWDALRPFCALLAILLAPWLGWWSLAVFLVAYNAVHLSVRVWLFRTGYRDAEGLIGALRRVQFPTRTKHLRVGAALLAGAVAMELVLMAGKVEAGGVQATSPLLVLGALLLSGWVSPRVHPLFLAAGALAFGLLGGLFF